MTTGEKRVMGGNWGEVGRLDAEANPAKEVFTPQGTPPNRILLQKFLFVCALFTSHLFEQMYFLEHVGSGGPHRDVTGSCQE